MAIDRVLIIILALAIVAIVLMIHSHAIDQLNRSLKSVLRPPKENCTRNRLGCGQSPLPPWRPRSWLYTF